MAVLLCLFSALAAAKDWTGSLVDAKCYAAEERNVGPRDTMTSVDRDRGAEIRYCSPSLKTRAFELVQFYGERLPLDPAGNIKAAGLVRKAKPKSSFLSVIVTGEMSGRTLKVDFISIAR